MEESFQARNPDFKVFTPLKNKPRVIYEIIKGVVGSFCKKDKSVSDLGLKTHLVKNFFHERSLENNFNDFTDSSSEWYLSLIENSKIISNCLLKGQSHILDIGCGKASLFRWLTYFYNLQLKSYLGIDINELCIEQCSQKILDHRAKFIACDANDIGDIWKRYDKYNLIFCINILPYIENLDIFAENIFNKIKDEAHVIVLDPVPSPYWEKAFGGFSIKIRTEEQILNIFGNNGLFAVERGKLCTVELFKKSIGQISSITIFSKRKPTN